LNRRILIIGSSGYIGQNFVYFLKKKKISFFTSHNTFNKFKKNIDILNFNQLDNFIKKNKEIKIILNFSGQQGKFLKKISHIGNQNLILIAKKYNIQIIFLSSVLVYGSRKNQTKENSIPKPITEYSKTKYQVEKMYIKSKVNFIIIRLANLYDNSFKKKGLLRNLYNSFTYNKDFQCSNINITRNFIHINDFNKILYKIMNNNEKFNNQILNISNENLKIIQIIKFFQKIYKKNIKIIHQKNNKKENFDNISDNSKLIKLLKYKKFTKLKDVIRNMKNEHF
jgi:nucleoside-diphosphate-sugar epimerase